MNKLFSDLKKLNVVPQKADVRHSILMLERRALVWKKCVNPAIARPRTDTGTGKIGKNVKHVEEFAR